MVNAIPLRTEDGYRRLPTILGCDENRFTPDTVDDALKHTFVPLFGVLSLGEIANSGKDYMELHNKTCVVGILGD